MSISAINCTPIKPNVSFNGKDDDNYALLSEKTEQVDEFIQSHEIKTPIAAAASVVLAAILAFASGKRIGALISSKFAKNAPEVMDKAIAKGSKYVNSAKDKLLNASGGNIAKVKNFAGKVIGKASELGSKGYAKLQTIGLPKDATVAQMKANGFNNIAGCAALATVFPSVISRDSNHDGVSDILEKGQNAYTGQTTYGKTKAKMEGLYNFVQQVVDVLS